MKVKQEKLNEGYYSDNDSLVDAEEKALILANTKAKRNLDETISSHDRYVSWYQYNVNNVDKYLQLCPHCKKPTLSAFDRTVIDSAIDLKVSACLDNTQQAKKIFCQPLLFYWHLDLGCTSY